MTAANRTERVTSVPAKLRERLELASRFAAHASAARDLTDLFRALYDATARVMDATVFLFALYDEASQTVHVVRQMDRGVEHPGGSFPLGKGFTSEVIRTAAPRLIRRWSAEGPPVRLLYGTEAQQLVTPQSAVVVPILSADRVLGVLSAQSYGVEAYDDVDLLSMSAIAAHAAAAIKRVRTTQQMALEHERRALQLEAVLATMADALLIVDARGAIVQLNRAAREHLGLDSASLVLGQPLEQQSLEQWPLTAREIAAALVPFIAALRAGTSLAEREVELRSGQLRVLSVSASVLGQPGGAAQGGVIVFRDVTKQRDLERLREDIFNMASHDLKTPIAVIRGHAELLLRHLASGERDHKALEAEAASIVTHTDRLAELFTTLFDVSSLDAGLLAIVRAPTDLGAIVRDVAEGMRSAARHDINVLAEQRVVGDWDGRRLRQVLMNLLSNALKYSPDGSTVTVSVSADERSATVSVRDKGIGLDGTELPQLFRRGYRAPSARSVIGGGLGLYFSNGIIAAHGGRMWAESRGHGRGSAFCFALPLSEPQAAGRPAEERA
jgi:PAS domain S-box-containing protein